MNANTIIMQTYDNPASTVACYEDLGTGQKSVNMMYCMAGHKISSGILSSGGNKPKGPKEVSDTHKVTIGAHVETLVLIRGVCCFLFTLVAF